MNKYTLRQTPLAVAIGTLLAGGAVEAATITVDTNADPGAEHQCSLRSAIASANTDMAVDGCAAGAGADEIVFDESLAHSTITLGAGQMEIDDTLTITGPVPGDAAGMTIDGNLGSRIFRAEGDSPSEFEVGLDSLTLTGGRTSTSGLSFQGGTIYALYANLSLAHVMVTGNSTGGGNASGGGLFVAGGNATLTHSTVSGNSTTGSFARGGGLRVFYGNATLINSTVSGNSTAGDYAHGGGMFVYGNVTLVNSTVSGNSTAGDNAPGGGMFVYGDIYTPVYATLTHATVAYNTAAGGTDGVHQGRGSTLTLNNSLIVQTGLGETACNQTADNHTNTLATDISCTDTATDVADIALDPLADNGGPTLTHALDAGSVARDGAGDCQADFGVSEDQRGEPRPGISSTACDIGAYESQFPLELSPEVLDFGSVALGETGGPLSLTVSNNGDDPLEVNGLIGLDAPFSLVSGGDCGAIPFTLAAGEDCGLDFVFAPTEQGTAVQPVNVDSDSFGGDEDFVLRGQGFSTEDEIFEDRFEEGE